MKELGVPHNQQHTKFQQQLPVSNPHSPGPQHSAHTTGSESDDTHTKSTSRKRGESSSRSKAHTSGSHCPPEGPPIGPLWDAPWKPHRTPQSHPTGPCNTAPRDPPPQGKKLAKLMTAGLAFTPAASPAPNQTAAAPVATPPTAAADFGNQMANMLNGGRPS